MRREYRADPGDHFLQAEWLSDVVVAAESQPADLVFGGIARGQEHHGGVRAAAAKPPDHVEPVHVGEHDVEDDEIRPVPARLLHGLGPCRRGHHLETRVTQASGEQFADARLVLDDKQPGIRGPTVTRRLIHDTIIAGPPELSLKTR